MAAFTLLLSLSLFLWSHTAQAAVLCTKKGGAVFLREACKAHETPVDPATLGIQPPAVYDSTGKKVGDTADTYGNLYFRFGEYVAPLNVTSDGIFSWDYPVRLYWASTDCSGTPFVDAQISNRLFPRSFVGPPGQTVYIPDPESMPQYITVMSFSDNDGPCDTVTQTPNAVRAIPSVDLNTLFTPPFRLR